ncbi:MAG: CDP-alcohol phosphatidyltransferase family protein [Chloroflexi bacterium]|nr:CDP-alcohol phosphatidyltransferase family protein [Chloroflexota bacterium]
MYRDLSRRLLTKHVEPRLGAFLSFLGLSPNHLTLLGLAFAGLTAYLLSQGWFVAGAVLLLIAGAFDLLDGMVARHSGRVTAFGAFLDSLVDRAQEAVVMLGLLLYYLSPPQEVPLVLVYLALVGSFLVSYARARGEGLGYSAQVGVLTRTERVLLLALGLFLNRVPFTLGLIAFFTVATTVQRALKVWHDSRKH